MFLFLREQPAYSTIFPLLLSLIHETHVNLFEYELPYTEGVGVGMGGTVPFNNGTPIMLN